MAAGRPVLRQLAHPGWRETPIVALRLCRPESARRGPLTGRVATIIDVRRVHTFFPGTVSRTPRPSSRRSRRLDGVRRPPAPGHSSTCSSGRVSRATRLVRTLVRRESARTSEESNADSGTDGASSYSTRRLPTRSPPSTSYRCTSTSARRPRLHAAGQPAQADRNQEMLHAERIAERILFLGGEVQMRVGREVEKIHDAREMVARAKAARAGGPSTCYNRFAAEAGNLPDSGSKKLFETHVVRRGAPLGPDSTSRTEHIERFGEQYHRSPVIRGRGRRSAASRQHDRQTHGDVGSVLRIAVLRDARVPAVALTVEVA